MHADQSSSFPCDDLTFSQMGNAFNKELFKRKQQD